MVNEEPGDEPAVKHELVNMEVAEQEVVEEQEENFFPDSDGEVSDTDSNADYSENEDSEDEGIVRSDQEDSEDELEEEGEEENRGRPFEEYLMEIMPDVGDVNIVLAYEKSIRDLINKEPRALINGHGVNNVAVYDEVRNHLEREQDLSDNAWRQTNLWPIVREAVRLYQTSNRLDNINTAETTVPAVVTFAFENAITTLLDGLQRPEPYQTWEGYQEAINYEDKRTSLLLDLAKKYHGLKHSRPGEEHTYGQVMPVQFSYDMIEYLMCALGTTGYSIRQELAENSTFYPEIDELEGAGRSLIEMFFVMDPSYRREFMVVVNELCHQANVELTEEDRRLVFNIFDEMNSVFSGSFESFVMYKADSMRRMQEIAEVRNVDPTRYRQLMAESDEADRNMMDYINNIEV